VFLFKTPEYALEAQGQYWSWRLPLSVFGDAAKLRDASDIDVVAKKIDELLPAEKHGLAELQKRGLALGFHRYLWDIAQNSEVSKFQTLQGEAQFDIKNIGNRQIDDIRVELPLTSGFYELIRPGETVTTTKFEYSIPCGSLRPGNSLLVMVWSSRSLDIFDEGRVRVTHPNGSQVVSFVARATGFFAFLVRNHVDAVIVWTTVWVGLLLLPTGVFKGWKWLQRKRIRPASNAGPPISPVAAVPRAAATAPPVSDPVPPAPALAQPPGSGPEANPSAAPVPRSSPDGKRSHRQNRLID
jgi:hypothetical protein